MDEQGLPRLKYEVNTKALDRLTNTYLGKNILVTNREEWSEEKIILAYRSQYLIEDVFKEMKDRRIGSWWPMYHWTDSKIRVHGLYCTIAMLLRGLLLRRIRRAGIDISMKRLLRELRRHPRGDQRVPAKTRPARARQQTVLSKTNELQDRLLSILALHRPEEHVLG